MILDIKACDPVRAQVVLDVFGHADFLPCVSDLAVKDKDAISASESVHVRQILASEAEVNGLDKSASARVNRLVDSGEHCIV